MKRREMKFVAGSLQLTPDRIRTAPALRKSATAARARAGGARENSRCSPRKASGVNPGSNATLRQSRRK